MTSKKRPGEFYRTPKQIADEYPVVEGTRCVQVKIPDDTSFLPVLAGMVAALGNTWSSIGGVEARREWAQMWQRAYAETDWSSCMNCEDLIACLTPLFEAQTANILTLINNQNNFGTSTPGLPLTTEELEENQAGTTNPGCDLDILWAQCLAIVQYTNESIIDTLEKVEAATNTNELAALVDGIPIIGWIAELFGSELTTDTLNYFQEAILESYAAQYTEAVENELACALFCVAMFDCSLSVELVYDMLYGRVSAIVPSNPAAMIDLLEMLAGIDFDGTNVVDLMFWFCWGGVKLASFTAFQAFIVDNFQLILALAVNDASADWLLLCDCGSDWNYELDSTTDPVWVEVPESPGQAGSIGGNVLFQTTAFGFTGITVEVTFPSVQHLTGIRINALETVGVVGAVVGNAFWALRDASDNDLLTGALPIIDEPWEVFEGFNVSGVKKVVIIYLFEGTTQEMTWQPVQLFGFGINPFV